MQFSGGLFGGGKVGLTPAGLGSAFFRELLALFSFRGISDIFLPPELLKPPIAFGDMPTVVRLNRPHVAWHSPRRGKSPTFFPPLKIQRAEIAVRIRERRQR